MSELFSIIDEWKQRIGDAPIQINWALIESLRDYHDGHHGVLTVDQERALRNIIRGYRMDPTRTFQEPRRARPRRILNLDSIS